MLEFFHQAQYGAIFLVVTGAFGYWGATLLGGLERAKATVRQTDVPQRIFYARFIAFGMVVCGLTWWVIQD